MAEQQTVEEPEIINPGGKGSVGTQYRQKYTEYSTEVRKISPGAFLVSLLALLLSIIPIIGTTFALFAMLVAKLRHASMILAVIAFIISCVSTTVFLLIVWVFRLIF